MNLNQVYDAENFRKQGHEIVDLLSDFLHKKIHDPSELCLPYHEPNELYNFWQNDLEDGLNQDFGLTVSKILERSISLHHPNYMGHQVGVVAPVTALASMVSALLNNGSAVYEMGMSSNAIEKVITNYLAKLVGYDEQAGGFLTSGGTLANLTAMLAARAHMTNVWEEGHIEKFAIMVSEEAHYCIDRAARIMGLGSNGIIKIPVNEKLQMETSLLNSYYENIVKEGYKVIAIVSSACSTSSGSYDDINAVADFAERNQIWHHVDAAHGGAVLFSKKYKYKVSGIQRADSITIDWHKMMMIPSLTTSLLFKNQRVAFDTFHQKAQYLWSDYETLDWFNSGKRTFECTKLMMSIKVYAVLKSYGSQMIESYIDTTHDLALQFYEMLLSSGYECAVKPQSNIVCFRKINSSLAIEEQNQFNESIVHKIREKGRYYIVQTKIKDSVYLRVSLMNPLTTKEHLKGLMEEIEKL